MGILSSSIPIRTDHRLPIAVMASGAGTTLEAIIYRSLAIDANFRVALVVSNNSQCGAMTFADMFFIPKAHISGGVYPDHNMMEQSMLNIFAEHHIQMIVLAGYMKKIPSSILRVYENRIINIHPALLPKFGGEGMYGINVHHAVIESGDTISGTTVHYVADEYDTGAIIAQESVEVYSGMSAQALAYTVQSVERVLYPATIQRIAANIREQQEAMS